MIRKRLLSACLALALCLGLLPVTALAAEVDAPDNLYVGNKNVRRGNDTTYWNTNNSGELTQVSDATDDSNDWTVKYDPNSATLTLKNATIKTTHDDSRGAMIYAQSVGSRAVSLTIQLVGENTIVCDSAFYGIYVDAEMSNDSYGTDASLTITGNGSLEVSGSSYGIWVKSGTGNASLNIKNVAVTSSTNGDYAAGVCVQSSTKATGSPQLSLAVDGGSLTTSASEGNDGIQFYVGLFEATGATTSLTVSDNAIVRANGGIKASRVDEPTPSGTGIVFDGTEGTVYGKAELQKDLEIGEGETLTIPEGASLTIDSGATLTNEGTVTNSGTLTNNGTIDNSGTLPSNIGGTAPPSITTPSLTDGTVGAAYTATLAADGEPTSWTWSADANSSLPPGLTLSGNSISGTPTTTGTYYFTVTASNNSGSDSKPLSITISSATNIPVQSVSLDKTSLELTEGGTGTLIATVEPNNATNKNVTWSTSNASIATVDANGLVTAVSAGTATITVTTEDGSFTANCTVTVSRYSTGGGPTTYAVTAPDVENGTVRVSPSRAARGTTVTITVTADEGYELERLTVLDSRDGEIALTDEGDGKYTFTMPAGRVTVAASFVESAPEPLPFDDVDDGDWFADAVRFVYENGMMNGTGDTTFAPDATTSRSMIVTILYRLEGEPVVDDAMDFSDVAGDAWYTDAVRWAAGADIVGGYGNGKFGTNDAVTREQLAAILYRYAVYKGYDVSIGEDTNILSYADFADLSEYAIPAMQWACGAGIVNGTGESTLTPQGKATRAQVAAMLMRFCENIVQ